MSQGNPLCRETEDVVTSLGKELDNAVVQFDQACRREDDDAEVYWRQKIYDLRKRLDALQPAPEGRQ